MIRESREEERHATLTQPVALPKQCLMNPSRFILPDNCCGCCYRCYFERDSCNLLAGYQPLIVISGADTSPHSIHHFRARVSFFIFILRSPAAYPFKSFLTFVAILPHLTSPSHLKSYLYGVPPNDIPNRPRLNTVHCSPAAAALRVKN